MRLLIKFLIKVYRNLLDPALKLVWPTGNCLFTPTCSHYFEEAVEKYGAFKGTSLAIKRLARCRPGSWGGFDPVI